MLTKHLKLLELLSTSYCVNLVTIALMGLKLHRGLPKSTSPAREGSKKPGLNRVNELLIWMHRSLHFASIRTIRILKELLYLVVGKITME